MGGDGGVVATNRRYMRGAGNADHTGDTSTSATTSALDLKRNQQREALELLTTCALTGAILLPTDNIVVCRYGRLYLKEAAVQVLLRRKMGTATNFEAKIVEHVSKLSELYAVRGSFADDKSDTLQWVCPITSKPLTGTVPPAVVLVPGNPENPNVVNEFALSQLSPQDLEMEYGPIQQKIRLAPTPEQLKEMKETLEQERTEREQSKRKKKEDKQSKHGDDDENNKKKKKRKRNDDTVADAVVHTIDKQAVDDDDTQQYKLSTSQSAAIRNKVDTAMQSNPILSGLFVDKK